MTHDHGPRADLSKLVTRDLGPVIVRHRGGVSLRLWRRMAMVAVDVWLVLGVARMALGSRDHFVRDFALLGLLAAALVLLGCLAIVAFARRYRYDIHQHGLALRGRNEALGALVPWATIDPGRVLISDPPRQVGRWTPQGLLEWAARPPLVLINGWVCRPNDQPHSLVHRFDSGAESTPFGWWQLGVTDPLHLLTAIESAMVTHGYSAQGMTAAAMDRHHVAGPATQRAARELERAPGDSIIGVRQGQIGN